MTLRHMQIFLAVCENNYNATRAAESQHMTQPAVSLAIKELEGYYGTVLFDRVGRKLQITEAGRRFREYAVRICGLYSDMDKQMRNWDVAGTLRVGASITIGSQFLPGYVRGFYERFPKMEIKAVIAPSDLLEQKILANELDIALIEGIAHSPALHAEAYMEDHLTVICAPDSGFAPGQILPIEVFQKQKFLLRERGSGTREIFDSAAERAGFSVEPIWEATSTAALVNAVINGLGIAVLPRRMVAEPLEAGKIVEIGVETMDFHRNFYIVHHRDKFLTGSARAFIQLCRGLADQ